MSASSFFWLSSLVTAVENGHGTRAQLTYISQLGLKSMLYKKLNIYGVDDNRWQNIAKALAKVDGDVSFKLANYYIDKQDGTFDTNRSIELWLLQAVRLGHLGAKVLLAQIYVDNNQLVVAEKLLLPIKYDTSALTLLIEISLLKGELKNVEQYSSQFKTIEAVNQKVEHQLFYKKLEKYGIIDSPTLETETETECLAKIAPFATNLDNLEYFEKLISSPNVELLKPYLCFSSVKYISKVELNCHHRKNEAIACDESIWQNKKGLTNNRFIAVLVDEGGANVNSGILYIDSHDTEEVFFHELTHLLGFIDEYPLPKNHFRCSAVQKSMFSHNIAILPRLYQGSRKVVRQKILNQLPWGKYISSHTQLVSRTTEGWKLGTLDEELDTVGAFIAESCNEKNFVSIRALKQRTALRYFEEKFPDLYMRMLVDNPDKYLMPHFTHNVLQATK
ncbi:MAG: hypothetical protein HRT54_00490 [Colwellia sp.]|nr:hypothetical protein [Colwellia sp.]